MSINEFTYFGVGAALGMAAAVLLSPKSGPDTRKYLRSKVGEGSNYVAARASTVRDSAAQAIKSGKKAVEHQAENFTAAVDAGVQSYREAVQTTP